MRAFLYSLPILVVLSWFSALLMLLPASVALEAGDHASARAFFYNAILVAIVTGMVAIVTQGRRGPHPVRAQLLALLGSFLLLPLIFAMPLRESLGDTSWTNAYFEMVSAMTTTGISVYTDPGRLSEAEEMWRATVAWGGGLLMWSAAVALFSPMGIGGYEVAQRRGPVVGLGDQRGQERFATERLIRAGGDLFPVFAGLTLALFVALLVAGDPPLTAAVHAMSTLATAGLSPVGGVENASSGRLGELMIAVFFVFALSRRTFATGILGEGSRDIRVDPELRLALTVVLMVSIGLFLRHYVAATQIDETVGFVSALRALWGTFFTALSFLTTSGYTSADWLTARGWSGIDAPGLLLMGLALMGGGVATTAGGVKLLRMYALLKHGQREIGRLVFPNSVGGAGRFARHLRREGAFIAWIVFMLLALSLAVVMLALSAASVNFEASMVLSLAALTNTGPLASYATADPIEVAALSAGAKYVLAAAMAVGRLETLAIVALLNPAFWRP
ncbi:MAG: TrkH family potassium uptake protein [Rhodobacteraceae bacterium]|nr:TrkH family potassium uptake protein [Paracoccaceae bacterium]